GAGEAGPGEAPIELVEGGLVAQLFDLLGTRLDEITSQFRLAGRVLREAGTAVDWWQYNLGTAERRRMVLDALLEIALVLCGAFVAEWLVAHALVRFRNLIESRASDREADAARKR